jgi:N-acetyl-gamma-glutamyl-phosphate reductase
MMNTVKVGIVGGTGYTGVELLRLIAQHPKAQLHMITSRKEAGMRVDALFPSLRGHVDAVFSDTATADLKQCDVVFYATPHGVAMQGARDLLASGVKVIDLAADFRLQDTAVFEQWYKLPHSCPDLLKEAVYGLPELNRSAIRQARLIGNPGCYPTTMQLGYAPLLSAGLIEPGSLIANCVSGISGAGKKAEIDFLFTETSDSFKAYGMSGHRHHPETVAQLQRINVLESTQPVKLMFTPHLMPVIRGMHSTLYATLNEAGLALEASSPNALQDKFEAFYANEPFVDVMPSGSTPDTRSVRASNTLRIAVHRPKNTRTVMLLVVQDNLVKGAAGQAVQCMNLMFDLPESSGLDLVPLLP